MNDESEITAPAPTEPAPETTPAPAVVPAEPQPLLGELLIAAREQKGLSAGDVARTLRLALRQIEALEAHRFELLPGHTFIRGFLRNYAKVVQADAEPFLEAYERTRPQPAAPEIVAPAEQIDYMRKPTPRWVWYVLGVVGVAVTVPLLIYALLQEDEVKPPVAAVPASTPAPAAPSGTVNEINLPLPPASPVPSGEPVAPPEAAVPAVPAAPLPAAAPAATSAVPVPPAAQAGQPKLVLRFSGDAWVEVRDKSGNKVFSQLGRRGTESPVHGTPPFALVVGNAAQVSVIYKDKPVDLAPHVKVNVARFSLE